MNVDITKQNIVCEKEYSYVGANGFPIKRYSYKERFYATLTGFNSSLILIIPMHCVNNGSQIPNCLQKV
jgi:hypothetical protein